MSTGNDDFGAKPTVRVPPTLPPGFSPSSTRPSGPVSGSPPTRVIGRETPAFDPNDAQTGAAQKSSPMDDPLAGWLVVVKGPGKGHFVRLGLGVNSVGRGAGCRVVVDFGDEDISRQPQFTVTYDGKHRKWYINHSEGKNLTYLAETPVLAPMELPTNAHISVGSTVLRFMPFCTDTTDWASFAEI